VRTLEALLPVLVTGHRDVADAVFGQLLDPAAHGGPCGPTQVHRGEPSFTERTYWRGPAWPQLTYLCWLAARRHGRDDEATALGAMLVEGAVSSGWAEYWDADDGTGLGAVPQSWATLAALVP
jgi:glycogen debranching enzyme